MKSKDQTKKAISDDDRKLFRDSVGNVTPLSNDRVHIPPAQPKPRVRRDNRTGQPASHSLPSARGGLQKRLLNKLRTGQLPIEAVLDLHGQRWEQAQHAIRQFLHTSQQHHLRTTLIIHGKGYHSDNGVAVLKELTQQILQTHPGVVSFAEAQPKDGGSGACYVRLKKST